MPNPFDELTLAEVDELRETCLGGGAIADSDPIQLAGGVMFLTQRRECPDKTWADFRTTTRMGDIKAFSEMMDEDNADPKGATS